MGTHLTSWGTLKASIGTLSNHDDEPSGRRPEVLERTRQPLRMSTLSSTSRSGREIQCFDVLRWTWVFQTIFNHFWAPFILFYNTVWAKQTFVLLFFEGWTAGAIFFSKKVVLCLDGSGGKESVSINVCFSSKLLSHYTYSEELFDLKKDRLDEFTFLTNLGVWIKDIVLHCIFEEGWLCFWMAGKNPWLFMFSFKAFEP